MKSVDFSTLTLQDALDLAILIEQEAAERYDDLANQMQTHATAPAGEFFRFMVQNETKHGDELSKRRKNLFGGAPRRVDSSMLFEVEAPEYDKVRAFMTVRQALEVALESEEKAHAFFEDAITHVKDEGVRKLFAELKNEELEHKALVAKQLDALPPDADIDVNDYVDEPVAQ